MQHHESPCVHKGGFVDDSINTLAQHCHQFPEGGHQTPGHSQESCNYAPEQGHPHPHEQPHSYEHPYPHEHPEHDHPPPHCCMQDQPMIKEIADKQCLFKQRDDCTCPDDMKHNARTDIPEPVEKESPLMASQLKSEDFMMSEYKKADEMGNPPCYMPQSGDDLPLKEAAQPMGPIGPWATGKVDWSPLAGITGTRPVVDHYSITRYSGNEWRQRNKEVLDKASDVFQKANKCKSTSAQQFSAMVSFMDNHPDLARGYANTLSAREKSKNLWKELENTLNCIGPVTRSVGGWKKVWADYKQNIKRKVRKLKFNMFKTDGGPNREIKLTDAEKKVYDLLNLKGTVYDYNTIKSFGVSLPKNNDDPLNPKQNLYQEIEKGYEELGLSSEQITAVEINYTSGDGINNTKEDSYLDAEGLSVNVVDNLTKNKNKRKIAENKENAFSKQIELQKDCYAKLVASLNENIEINKNILKATQELVDLKKEKKQKTEIYRQQKLTLWCEELRVKRRKLAIEEEKLKLNTDKKLN